MLITAPLLVVVASLGGYFIIKRAFRPLATITKTAETIKNDHSYHLRVPFINTSDEVSHLPGMMKVMLDQVEHVIEREREFSANVSMNYGLR